MSVSDDTTPSLTPRPDASTQAALLAASEAIFSAEPVVYDPADPADVQFLVAVGAEVQRRIEPLAAEEESWMAVLRSVNASLLALSPLGDGPHPKPRRPPSKQRIEEMRWLLREALDALDAGELTSLTAIIEHQKKMKELRTLR